ncbi:MAG: ferritin [Deltaproteobacteria bacterium]|nr:ferritin [Deltaproteobacteria bacterium]
MIGKKLNDAMNEQIKNELESYYIYLSMAAWLHSKSLDGMGHWMRVQAHEEMLHAMKFFNHLIDRGGKVALKDLKQLKTQWKSPLEVFQDAFEHEKFISKKINDLMSITRQEKEYASEPLLAWFTDEQIEEESNASKITGQLEMVGTDKSGLLMLDRELAARAYPPGSPLNPVAAPAA